MEVLYLYRICLLSHCFLQVRDQLSLNRPSEVQIPIEEVQNPCRLVLRHPDLRLSSRAHHGPKGLLILTIGLLHSSLFMIE